MVHSKGTAATFPVQYKIMGHQREAKLRGGSWSNAGRQDETFCNLSPASLDEPFKSLLLVSENPTYRNRILIHLMPGYLLHQAIN